MLEQKPRLVPPLVSRYFHQGFKSELATHTRKGTARLGLISHPFHVFCIAMKLSGSLQRALFSHLLGIKAMKASEKRATNNSVGGFVLCKLTRQFP